LRSPLIIAKYITIGKYAFLRMTCRFRFLDHWLCFIEFAGQLLDCKFAADRLHANGLISAGKQSDDSRTASTSEASLLETEIVVPVRSLRVDDDMID